MLASRPGADWTAESSVAEQALTSLTAGLPDDPAVMVARQHRPDEDGGTTATAAVAVLATRLPQEHHQRLQYRLETLAQSVE